MFEVVARDRLSDSEVRDVLAMVSRVTQWDGLAPLSEHVLLHLRHGGDEHDVHLLALDAVGGIVGYGHLDGTDLVNGPSAELAVDPPHRKQGIAAALVTSMLDRSADGRLRLWAHGEQAPARALAASLGFHHARTLLQMRRSLRLPLPEAPLPEGVHLRTFRPGIDDAEWLRVNARCFAGHPEQGHWTERDLAQRMSEPWFDPAGFLIAEKHGRMVGFHWTKVHGRSGHLHGHEEIGEVYVICVDPSLQGHGLGRALTVAGLRHLRDKGLSVAMLYVDAGSPAPIALYSGLGFTEWDTDVEFHRTR